MLESEFPFHYYSNPNTAGGASRSEGGTATGTETPNTGPANRRTASGNPTQPDQAAANTAAAEADRNPTTTTAPENDRTDARTRQRRAPHDNADPTSERHQGAHSGTGEPGRTTTRERATTGHPKKARTERPETGAEAAGNQNPPATPTATRTARPRRTAQGREAAKRTLAPGDGTRDNMQAAAGGLVRPARKHQGFLLSSGY